MRYIYVTILALMILKGPLAFAQGETPVMPNTGVASKVDTKIDPVVMGEKISPVLPSETEAASQKEVSKSQSYRIGVADVLDINVIRPIPINSRTTVASDGAVMFPYIGSVRAKDRTLAEVQSEIQDRLSQGGYMDYPVVSVSLYDARSKKFTIYGEVIRPGAYPVQENMPLLRAISMAGGLSIPDSTGVVRVLRLNKDGTSKSVVFESDISEVLNGKQDLFLQPGDTITVVIDKFFIYGEVYHPGSYPVQENMTLPDAITIAGGFAFTSVGGYIESGSMGRIKVFRAKPQQDESPIFESDINSILAAGSQKVIVHAGDTLVVSLDKYFITGQVNRPGAYPVAEHMSLLDAISTAGGFTTDASTGEINLLRHHTQGGSAQQVQTDVTSVLNGTAPDVSIHPMDTIVVTANKFYVYGEVDKPGMYPLESKTTALTAISIAGGFGKFGSASRVKVLRMDEKTGRYKTIKVDIKEAIAGNSQADVLLMPNDVVVISEGIF